MQSHTRTTETALVHRLVGSTLVFRSPKSLFLENQIQAGVADRLARLTPSASGPRKLYEAGSPDELMAAAKR